MGTRDGHQTRTNDPELVSPVIPCPPQVQQSPALNSAVTELNATQGMMVEHMWILSRDRGHTMGSLDI